MEVRECNPVMHIEMEAGGMIDIELFPDVAHNTVCSVIWLANQGLYDGRDFYRVVKDFVLQTDCDIRPGMYETGCNYILDGEYRNSGYTVEQPVFEKYIVGMAGHGNDSNISSGSSFFIQTGSYKGLDGNFAVIGRVIGGFEVVDKMNNTPCNRKMFRGTISFHTPKEPQRISRLWVDTQGVDYEPPKTKRPSKDYIEREKELDELIDFYRDDSQT